MNTTEEKSSNIIPNSPKKGIEINEKNIVGEYSYININYDEIKKVIEYKVDLYMMKEYYELFDAYDEKIYNLLLTQEKLFIKNEIMNQKLNYLINYLKCYCKKKHIDYETFKTQ